MHAIKQQKGKSGSIGFRLGDTISTVGPLNPSSHVSLFNLFKGNVIQNVLLHVSSCLSTWQTPYAYVALANFRSKSAASPTTVARLLGPLGYWQVSRLHYFGAEVDWWTGECWTERVPQLLVLTVRIPYYYGLKRDVLLMTWQTYAERTCNVAAKRHIFIGGLRKPWEIWVNYDITPTILLITLFYPIAFFFNLFFNNKL